MNRLFFLIPIIVIVAAVLSPAGADPLWKGHVIKTIRADGTPGKGQPSLELDYELQVAFYYPKGEVPADWNAHDCDFLWYERLMEQLADVCCTGGSAIVQLHVQDARIVETRLVSSTFADDQLMRSLVIPDPPVQETKRIKENRNAFKDVYVNVFVFAGRRDDLLKWQKETSKQFVRDFHSNSKSPWSPPEPYLGRLGGGAAASIVALRRTASHEKTRTPD